MRYDLVETPPKIHAIVKSFGFGLLVLVGGTLGYVVIEGMNPFDAEERLKLAGANRVLNPYLIGGMRLALSAIKPTVTDFIDESLLGSSVELELAEIVIDPSSELAGKTLAGAEVRQRFGIIVVALKRGDEAIFNPDAQETIEGGDVLVALGPLSAIERVEKAVQ